MVWDGTTITMLKDGIIETLFMVFGSSLIAYMIGIPLGIILVVTDSDGIRPIPGLQKVLGLVGLSGFERKYPVEMSIGEGRKVELARALIASPPVLVLDEITANLDDDTIWDVLHLLRELNNRGTTIIMATHASQYVNIMRQRVVTLVDGRLFGDVRNGRYGDIV